MTWLRRVLMVLEDGGWPPYTLDDRDRVMARRQNLDQAVRRLEEIESRVTKGHTSAAVEADVTRWCFAARLRLALPNESHPEIPLAEVVQLKGWRERLG